MREVNERVDLIEKYLATKHNYSQDEVIEICNRLPNGEYLADALTGEIFKIEGTLDHLNKWVLDEIDEENERLKEIGD
jgi:hypothetical protein